MERRGRRDSILNLVTGRVVIPTFWLSSRGGIDSSQVGKERKSCGNTTHPGRDNLDGSTYDLGCGGGGRNREEGRTKRTGKGEIWDDFPKYISKV